MPRQHGLFQNYIESTSPTLRTTQTIPYRTKRSLRIRWRQSNCCSTISAATLGQAVYYRDVSFYLRTRYQSHTSTSNFKMTLVWMGGLFSGGVEQEHTATVPDRVPSRDKPAREPPPFFPTSSLSSVPGTASEEPMGPSTS